MEFIQASEIGKLIDKFSEMRNNVEKCDNDLETGAYTALTVVIKDLIGIL
jgi:3-dehydroquinate dehydratase